MPDQILVSDLDNIDIQTADMADLVDMSGFTFDYSIPQTERAAKLINTVKNPYCFRVGDIGVKLEFANDAPTLQDVFSNLLHRKKSGL